MARMRNNKAYLILIPPILLFITLLGPNIQAQAGTNISISRTLVDTICYFGSGLSPETTCVNLDMATTGNVDTLIQPVDVVLVIDTTGSMKAGFGI